MPHAFSDSGARGTKSVCVHIGGYIGRTVDRWCSKE